MPRSRDFDTEELLDQILLIFLENGWQQTSMRLLESFTGVKQVSLYNAFGNKEALFLAAFDNWAKQAADAQDRFMKGNGIEGIARFVKRSSGKTHLCQHRSAGVSRLIPQWWSRGRDR